MSPFETVLRMYRERPLPGDLDFEAYLEEHLVAGFLYSTPDYFVMGRPVIRRAPEAQITDCFVRFPRAVCDCWHVHAMAGDVAKVWDVLPWPLPWLSFERELGGALELRFYSLEGMKRLSQPPPCAKNTPSPVSSASSLPTP